MRNLVTWTDLTLWMKLQKIDEIAREDLNLTHSRVSWVTYKKLNEIKWNSQMGERGTNWWCLTIYVLMKVVCSFCFVRHVDISQSTICPNAFLVPLQKLVINTSAMKLFCNVWTYSTRIIECWTILSLNFSKMKNKNLKVNWGMLLVVLESAQWVRFCVEMIFKN
jgi:hypothetical protein